MTSREALEELAKVYGYYFGDRYQLQEMKKAINDVIEENESLCLQLNNKNETIIFEGKTIARLTKENEELIAENTKMKEILDILKKNIHINKDGHMYSDINLQELSDEEYSIMADLMCVEKHKNEKTIY